MFFFKDMTHKDDVIIFVMLKKHFPVFYSFPKEIGERYLIKISGD